MLVGTAILGASCISYAATEATVAISAIVTKECTLALDKTSIALGSTSAMKSEGLTANTVKVTTNCGGGSGKLTLTSPGADGKNIILTHTGKSPSAGNTPSKLKVALRVAGKDAVFASGAYEHNVVQNTSTTDFVFSGVAGQKSDTLDAGEYKGSVTVKVAPI
ncbi:hypothetical protein [Providencia sp. JUb39]|uniref:hypothetical protein n=1 Tax=Providencia sp. JUb39 TaxID=2724165 RepID=UPI00164E094E|nr:hypothetical protein [Providencia sp. JUb39]MBC5792346.1 hypothetical protein [Providencia sp. JUb39]